MNVLQVFVNARYSSVDTKAILVNNRSIGIVQILQTTARRGKL